MCSLPIDMRSIVLAAIAAITVAIVQGSPPAAGQAGNAGSALVARQAEKTRSRVAAQPVRKADSATCTDNLAFQVLLNRRGFSPGEIDGRIGPNASRALTAFQQSNHLQ